MQIKIVRTNDTRPWTEHKARNIGARNAKGEYLLMIDMDYIIPEETIKKAMEFTGDRMPIKRRFGVLDQNGNITDDPKSLRKWGLKKRWIRKREVPGHRSQFLMKKELFWKMGGYNEGLDGKWRRTGGAGEKFWRKWQKLENCGKVVMADDTLDVFMFPGGKFCDFERQMFSGLKPCATSA
jgi:glycosyltransferase involved in cell wall biosynthesis